MKYPTLASPQTSRDMVDVFGGYNHNLRIGVGEFYDMTNLSSSAYPVLSPRPKRGVYTEGTYVHDEVTMTPSGMIAKDALCYVDGPDFVINEYHVPMGLSLDSQKTLVSMGAYVIIMPDKKYVNTADISDYGEIEAKVTTTSNVTFSLCKNDGALYYATFIQSEEPTEPENMDLWIDTSSTPNSLKQYSSNSAMWVPIATTYVKIEATGIGKPFSEGDGVTISGVTSTFLADLNSNMIIQARGDNYIVVTGILDYAITQYTPVTVSRLMPTMDFIIESENRLWGCRYGTALNGDVVNEIYACKLGDFKNWNYFAGVSTDSYAATVGTDGQFTGAIAHLGYPLFFKETCIHKVYGNFPANYQIQTTTCRGVQKGSERSLAIVNEVLYYKARSGVCAYDGSLPVEMSSALGDVMYGNAAAGALGNKYYISMQDTSGVYHLFVYDAIKGMWHREDNTHALEFCTCRGELYYTEHGSTQIKTIMGSGTTDETPVSWMAETGVIGTDSPDKKYISRMDVRLSLELGATVMLFIQYDSFGGWELLHTMTGTALRSFCIPIRPKRCDHLRLRMVGQGVAKIFSICKTVEQGSDV